MASQDFPNVVGNEGFLFSEANGHLAREEGVLAASQDVKPGTFAARLTSGGQLVRHSNPNTTPKIYARSDDAARREASGAVESRIVASDLASREGKG